MRRIIFVPPNGFQGFAQQSIATKALLNRSTARRRAPTKRRKTARTTTARRKPGPPVRRIAKKRHGGNIKIAPRMVKGSAAAKRHMSKLRKMRRR